MALTVSRKRLLESGECNLSGDRYQYSHQASTRWPMVKLGDDGYFKIESGGTPSSNNPAS